MGKENVELKLKTKKVKGVEICRVGNWNGVSWNAEDFDQAIKNFDARLADAPLILTRDGTHGSQRIVMPGGASLGKVEKLYRDGDVLKADFKNVPTMIADLLEVGAFDQKSIEGWVDFVTADGEHHGRVVDGVLFFGVGLPAVHGLSDLMQFYETSDANKEGRFSCSSDIAGSATGAKADAKDRGPAAKPGHIETTKGERNVGDENKVSMSLEQRDKLIRDSEKAVHLQKIADDATKKAEEAEAARVEMQKELDELRKKNAEHEADIIRHQREQLSVSVDKLIEAGKLEPASKEATIAYCNTLDENKRAEYLKTIEGLKPLFGETVPTGTPGAKVMPKDPADQIHAIAIEYQKKAGCSYEEARERVISQMEG